jgi:AraC-like DNA-binding protein
VSGVNKCVSLSENGIFYSHTIDFKSADGLNISHCHDTYEILYVSHGKGRYIIEGSEFPLLPRTLVIIKPFEYHFVEVDKDSDYNRYVIHFSHSAPTKDAAKLLDEVFETIGVDSGCFYSPDSISQAAVSVFDRFEQAMALPEEFRGTYLKLTLSELILLLSATTGRGIMHNDDELGARVAKYINDYLDKSITLDLLAKRFFVSKYYLCRAFKKYSGVSVHSYIIHKRVIYAKQLIDAGETASAAAYKVGFGDYSAFYRAYVKFLGIPPSKEGKRTYYASNSAKG